MFWGWTTLDGFGVGHHPTLALTTHQMSTRETEFEGTLLPFVANPTLRSPAVIANDAGDDDAPAGHARNVMHVYHGAQHTHLTAHAPTAASTKPTRVKRRKGSALTLCPCGRCGHAVWVSRSTRSRHLQAEGRFRLDHEAARTRSGAIFRLIH